MKPNVKSLTALFFIVATVYVMRSGNVNSGHLAKGMLRILYSYARPTSDTCKDVSLASQFTADDITRSTQLQQSLASVRKGNPFQDLLQSGNMTGNLMTYVMGLIPSLAVWAALFVISFILCCCALCNWCCIYGCCKNCKCCRCCKKPQGTKRKRVYQICSLVFMLSLFAAGIAGAAVSGAIPKGILVSYCAVINFMENLCYGQQSSKWLGLGGINFSLKALSGTFKTAIESTADVGSSTTTLNTHMGTINTALETFYSAHSGSTDQVARVDPAIGGNYNTEYAANLGPRSTATTYTGKISAEMLVQKTALDNSQGAVNEALANLRTQKDTITSSINSGVSTTNTVYNSLDGLVKTLIDAGTLVNDAIGKLGQAILGIFVCFILLAVLPIVSIALIHFLKIKFFSKVLHASWCLMGILTILGFLVSIIFYPVSVVFSEVCQVLTVALNDKTFFQATLGSALASISPLARDMTVSCVHGDGGALSSLGLADKFANFDTIYSKIDAISAVADITSASPTPNKNMTYQRWYTDAIQTGYVVDSENMATDLKTLNALTTADSNSCTPVHDNWLLHSVNCTVSGETTFTSSSASNFNLPSKTCIPMNNWITASATPAGRYGSTQFPASPTCAQKNNQEQLTYVQNFVANLKTTRQAVSTKYGSTGTPSTIMGGLNTVYTSYNSNYGPELYNLVHPFYTLKQNLASVQDALIGTDNGLLPNTNCKFVGEDLRTFSAALCTGFIASLYQTSVVLIVVSMFSFFGSIAVFCLAKRILNEDSPSGKDPNNEQYQY